MNPNMLKLNDDKTELIVFTSKYKHNLYNDLSTTIRDTVVHKSRILASPLIECYRYVSMFLILQRRVDCILETLVE